MLLIREFYLPRAITFHEKKPLKSVKRPSCSVHSQTGFHTEAFHKESVLIMGNLVLIGFENNLL